MKLLKIIALLILAVSLPFAEIERSRSTDLELTFLDVGQGDSILIKTPANSYGLIDVGRGESILNPLGRYMPNSVRDFAFVILTHPDADHVEGVLQLAKRYRIENLFINKTTKGSLLLEEILSLIKTESIKNFSLYDDNDFDVDGVHFDILWPENLSNVLEEDNTNESSIALLLKYKNFELYTAGDLGKVNELKSIESLETISADVLKVGHHGSSTSSDEAFVKKLAPKAAVIQVGKANAYGHPTLSTIQTLEANAQAIYRTDQLASIKISTDGVTAYVMTEGGALSQLAL